MMLLLPLLVAVDAIIITAVETVILQHSILPLRAHFVTSFTRSIITITIIITTALTTLHP